MGDRKPRRDATNDTTMRHETATKTCKNPQRNAEPQARDTKKSPRDAKGPQNCCLNHFVTAHSKSLGVVLLCRRSPGAFVCLCPLSVLTSAKSLSARK